MRIPLTGRISIVLIVVGSALLIYPIHRQVPHSRVVLDMPVSLAPGRIMTGTFNVDLDTLHYVDIEIDRRGYPSQVGCEPHSVLRTQWTLSSDGKVVSQGSSPWEDSGLTIGDLLSENTRYSLDVSVFPGATCLNAGNPRLKIQTHTYPSDPYASLIWLSLLSIGTGFVLLVRFWFREVSTEKPTLRIFPGMVVRNVLPLQRHRPMPLMTDLPNFGLVWGCILFIEMFIFMIVHPLTPHGLLVNLRERNAVVWQKSPWPETLSVYVDGQRRFYVNGQPVLREELRAKLSEELGKRTVWIVYFEADGGCPYIDAVYSMDTIQGVGAKVVWITPQIREELTDK